jgi:hypothetical protein
MRRPKKWRKGTVSEREKGLVIIFSEPLCVEKASPSARQVGFIL